MPAAPRPDEATWLQALPEAVLIARDGVVAYANPAAHALFSPSAQWVLAGEPVSRLLPPSDGGGVQAMRLDGHRFAACIRSVHTNFGGDAAVLHVVRDIEHEQALRQALAQQHRELLALSGRFIEIREQERRHLARELHDDIGQCLSAIRVQFAKLQRRVESPEALALIASAAGMTEQTLGSVRNLSRQLHPPQLETLGLTAALRWHLQEQQALHGLRIAFTAEALAEPLPQDVALAAYRIVQESLSNAVRHAGAQQVDVALAMHEDALTLTVSDDGCGFDADGFCARTVTAPSLGLMGMKERARLLGGELQVLSAPGQGTRIAARFSLIQRLHHDDSPGDIG